MIDLPIKTTVEDGQPYVDEPIVVGPKKDLTTGIAWELAKAFGNVRQYLDQHGMPHTEIKGVPPITVGYKHIRLKWMRPVYKDGQIVGKAPR
jgi:hypothetical protein